MPDGKLFEPVLESVYEVETQAEGPRGSLPLTPEMLRHSPSGDIFGLAQNAGMGWEPSETDRRQFLILSTQGGIRAPDGRPIALGYHTGHWEVGLLMEAAAREFSRLGFLPFAGFVSDPCDGRSQGTTGMFDSLAYRNDAAIVLRRLIRSLPRRAGVMGIGSCDKGLPAMLMALAGCSDLPGIIVPGGVTLPARDGEDAGKVQSIGARFSHGLISLQEAADLGCRACATPGGGCQFLGTAATTQVVAEALGLTLPHAALSPSGQPIWRDLAIRSARALAEMHAAGVTLRQILTPRALENAMTVHAAVGGSTNLLLHIPAIAHAAGLPRPGVADWARINSSVPRLVDVLPNGPAGHPTIQFFMAGGTPEVMLHLRDMGLLHTGERTVSGATLDELLDAWLQSDRRRMLRERLWQRDGIDPENVIMDAATATSRGLTSTVTFVGGNLAPEGGVIKSTAIDPEMLKEGIYLLEGPARVFVRETAAIEAVKSGEIRAGDVLVLACRGPLGSGMEETYELTSALRYLPFGRHVALITDARFSGVSTGPCIGHVGPEALAGGPLGRLVEGDLIRVEIDTRRLTGSIDLVGEAAAGAAPARRFSPAEGARLLAARRPRPDLSRDPHLPDDTRLWAALQQAGGGAWGGCVYDVDAIVQALGGTGPAG